MKILDRQRYWAFLKAYLICFIALIGLYVVFDAFEHIDEFARSSNGTVGMMRKMGRYYLVRVSLFYDRLCGVISMMAAVFTVTWLQKNNELLAMLAAGLSTQRVIRPVLISAVLISGVAVANQEWIIPQVAEELQLPAEDDGKRELRVYGRTDVNDIYLHGVSGDRATQTVSPFDVTMPPSRFGQQMNLEAKEAIYIEETDDASPIRGGWLLRGARLSPANTKPDGTLLLEVSSEEEATFPCRKDRAVLVGETYFLRTNVSFAELTRSLQWYQYAAHDRPDPHPLAKIDR